MKTKVFLDVECYSNYFLICFKSDTKTRFYEMYNDCLIDIREIKSIMTGFTTIGFNSNRYDLPMISYALQGVGNHRLKELSDSIITSGWNLFTVKRKYGIYIPGEWDHIDLIEPAPALGVGLKMYGARMHCPTLQDLPLEPDSIIKPNETELLRKYCANDVFITAKLYENIKESIDLRVEITKNYDVDVRSKSKAQIAEILIKKSLNITGYFKNEKESTHKYTPPDFINFKTEDVSSFFNDLLRVEFKCNNKGKLIKTPGIYRTIDIEGSKFAFGIGGLHSKEKHTGFIPDEDEFILNVDVVSYYPSIILNNKYYPETLGEEFLKLYDFFYKERIIAKKNKDKVKSETYKIILNSGFGKFGSPYSSMYSPSLLLHTTLTGQLSLLMLIETLTLQGYEIISANTDGITIKGRRDKLPELNISVSKWEELSGLKLERIFYKSVYHESVNNYIAITEDEELHSKGFYANPGLTKNPVTRVCFEAVVEYIRNNKNIESYIIENSNDIRKFLIIRKVEGGAVYKGDYLGKIVRWYYGLDGDIITYKKNGNKVAGSDGAIPLQTLPEDFKCTDIDLNKYFAIAYKILKNLGVKDD